MDNNYSFSTNSRFGNVNQAYQRRKLIGKGRFAKCYEIINTNTNNLYACKVLPKEIISERENISDYDEMTIHESLNHRNIVKFLIAFEDNSNIYIIMELCTQRTLSEFQMHRITVTPNECRYFIKNIASGVEYLHAKKLLHRDLKLSNIFLNDKLQVKIGDFGLAIMANDVHKFTEICGNANYLAPEILTIQAYSYASDIWSIGCMMFKLLTGNFPFDPPFQFNPENANLDGIENNYQFLRTPNLSKYANDLLSIIFSIKPSCRPSATTLMQQSDFITKGFIIPHCLPLTSLIEPPKCHVFYDAGATRREEDLRSSIVYSVFSGLNLLNDALSVYEENYQKLWYQLESLKQFKQSNPIMFSGPKTDENTDPELEPYIWLLQWVIDEKNLSFAYQLTNKCIVLQHIDGSKLIQMPNGVDIQYIDQNAKVFYVTAEIHPVIISDRINVLSGVSKFLNEHLPSIKMPRDVIGEEFFNELSYVTNINLWFHCPNMLVVHYTNDSIQFFLENSINVIYCPRMNAVTYINADNEFYTTSMSTIETNGCSFELYEKLELIHDSLDPSIWQTVLT